MHVSLPVNFLWTRGKMFTVICLPVASTEAVNKSVGKGKKVNTTKGDKKLQQPEQEVGSTERYVLSVDADADDDDDDDTFCFTV